MDLTQVDSFSNERKDIARKDLIATLLFTQLEKMTKKWVEMLKENGEDISYENLEKLFLNSL